VRMDRSGRLSIEVRVDSKSDPDLVRSLLVELAKEHRHVLDKPSPYVLFNDFGTNALHFDLRAFVDDVDHMGGARSDLRYEIFRRFRDAGLVMA
jgi:potassium efflux system protein